MTNTIIDYEDLKLIMNYLDQETHGGPLRLSIREHGRVEIKTANKLGEDITLRIFASNKEGSNLAPRIVKEDKLTLK